MLPSLPFSRLSNCAKLLALILAPVLLIALISIGPSAAIRAQEANGKVCVLAFNDANRNRVRDPGEALLPDISVNLMVNQNVIIANHVTDGNEPYCFSNLPPQQYTVTFSSPLYEATTSTGFAYSLAPGETAQPEFGAVPRGTPTDTAVSTTGLRIPMTTPVRIGLAAAGALIVMLLFTGIGMIIYGLFVRR